MKKIEGYCSTDCIYCCQVLELMRAVDNIILCVQSSVVLWFVTSEGEITTVRNDECLVLMYILNLIIFYSQGDAGQWQIVFYIAAVIYLFGAIVYGLLASGTRQKWAEVPTGYLPHTDGAEHDD